MVNLGSLILASELVTPVNENTFWSQWGQFFVNIGAWLLNGIAHIAYYLCRFALHVIDFMQMLVQKLAGVEAWVHLDKLDLNNLQETDVVFRFLLSDRVMQVFRTMVAIFFVLLLLFSIIAIIKNEYGAAADGKEVDHKKTWYTAFKAVISVALVPVLLIGGILTSNAILASLMKAFSVNSSLSMGGQVFVASAYSASSYRMYATNGVRKPVSNISSYQTFNGQLYYIDTTAKVIKPREYTSSSPFYGYMITFNGKDYFLWEADEAEEYSGTTFIGKNYYYLKYVLGAYIVEKTPGQRYVAGVQISDTEVKYYKDNFFDKNDDNTIVNKISNWFNEDNHASKCKMLNNGFIQGYNLHGLNAVDLDYSGVPNMLLAAYNSWSYNAALDDGVNGWKIEDSVGASMNTIDAKLESYVTNMGVTKTAYTINNSKEWGRLHDGGVHGFAPLSVEYLVMADVVDFALGEDVPLYIINATNANISWNYGSEAGSFDQNTRYSRRSGLDENGFLVSYDVGTVAYPIVEADNEIQGGLFVVCYYSSKLNKYVPLTNGIKMYDDYGNSHTFTSGYYSNDYHGVVIARGLFDSDAAMSFSGASLHPTYISQESPLTGGNTPTNYDNRAMISAFLENVKVSNNNEYNYTYIEKLTNATDSEITTYSDANVGDLVLNIADSSKTLYYFNDESISATNRGNMASTLWNKISSHLTGFSLYSDGSYYKNTDLAADGQFEPGDTFDVQLKYGAEEQRYDLTIRYAVENNIKAQDGSERAEIYRQTFYIDNFKMFGNSVMPTAPVKAFEQIFAGDPAADTDYAYEVVSESTGATTAPIRALYMYDKHSGTNRNALITASDAQPNIIKAVLSVINSGDKTYGFVEGSYYIDDLADTFPEGDQKFAIELQVYDTAFSSDGTATGNYVPGCKTYTVRLEKYKAADADVVVNVGGTDVTYSFKHSFKISIDDTEESHLGALVEFNDAFDRLLDGKIVSGIIDGESTDNVIYYDGKIHFFATDNQFDTHDHAVESTEKLAQKVAATLAAEGYTLVNDGETIVNGVVKGLTTVIAASKTEYQSKFVIKYQDANGNKFGLNYSATLSSIRSTNMYVDDVVQDENRIYERAINLSFSVQNTFKMHFAPEGELNQAAGEFVPNTSSEVKGLDGNTLVITANELTYVSGQDSYEFYVGETGHVQIATVQVSKYSYTIEKEINGKPVTETYIFNATTSGNGKVDSGLEFMGYTYTKVGDEYKYVVNDIKAKVGSTNYDLSESQIKQIFYGYVHTEVVQLPDYVWIEKSASSVKYHFINAEDISLYSIYEYVIDSTWLNKLPELDFGQPNSETNPIDAFTNSIVINQYTINDDSTITKNSTYTTNFAAYKNNSPDSDYISRASGDNATKIKADIKEDIEHASSYVRTHVNISIDWMPLISFAGYEQSGESGDISKTFVASVTGLYGTPYNMRATNIDSIKNKYTEDKNKRNVDGYQRNYADYDKVLKAYQNEFVSYMTSIDVGTAQNLHSAIVGTTSETETRTKELVQNPTKIAFCREKLKYQWIEADILFLMTWEGGFHFGWRWWMAGAVRRENTAFASSGSIQNNSVVAVNRGVISLDYGFSGNISVDNLYQVANINWIVLLFAIVIIFGILGNAVWGLIRRIYQITLLFLVSPAVASTMPIDEKGQRFTTWRTKIISEVLGAYGVCLGLNFFFIIIPIIRDASAIFTKADFASLSVGLRGFLISVGNLNGIVYLLFLLVALTLLKTVPAFVMEMLGDYGKSDVIQTGKDTKGLVKTTLSEAGNAISGQSAINSVKSVKDTMKGMIPGKAIYDAIKEKRKKKKEEEQSKKDEFNKQAQNDAVQEKLKESGLLKKEEGEGEEQEQQVEETVKGTTEAIEGVLNEEGENTNPEEVPAEMTREEKIAAVAEAMQNGGTHVDGKFVKSADEIYVPESKKEELWAEADKKFNEEFEEKNGVGYDAALNEHIELARKAGATGAGDHWDPSKLDMSKLSPEEQERYTALGGMLDGAYQAKKEAEAAAVQDYRQQKFDEARNIENFGLRHSLAGMSDEELDDAAHAFGIGDKNVTHADDATTADSAKTVEEGGEEKQDDTTADENAEYATKEEVQVLAQAISDVSNNLAGKGHDYYQDKKDQEKDQKAYEHSRAGKAEAREQAALESGKMAYLTEGRIERYNQQHAGEEGFKELMSNKALAELKKKIKSGKGTEEDKKKYDEQKVLHKEARLAIHAEKMHNITLDEQNGIRHGLGYSILRKVVGGRKTMTQQMKEAEKLDAAKRNMYSLKTRGVKEDSPEYKAAAKAVAKAEKRVNDTYKGFLLKGGRGMLNGARFVGAKAAVAGRFAREYGLGWALGATKRQKGAAENVLRDYLKQTNASAKVERQRDNDRRYDAITKLAGDMQKELDLLDKLQAKGKGHNKKKQQEHQAKLNKLLAEAQESGILEGTQVGKLLESAPKGKNGKVTGEAFARLMKEKYGGNVKRADTVSSIKTKSERELIELRRARYGDGKYDKSVITNKAVQQALRLTRSTNATSVGIFPALARSGFGRGVAKAAKGTANFFAGMFGGRLTKLGNSKSSAYNVGNALSWMFAPTGILKAATFAVVGAGYGLGKGIGALGKGASWIGKNTVGKFHNWNVQRKDYTAKAKESFKARSKDYTTSYLRRVERAGETRARSLLNRQKREFEEKLNSLEKSSKKGAHLAFTKQDINLLREKLSNGTISDEEMKRLNIYMNRSNARNKIKDIKTTNEISRNKDAVKKVVNKDLATASAKLKRDTDAALNKKIKDAIKDYDRMHKSMNPEAFNRMVRQEVQKMIREYERGTRRMTDIEIKQLRQKLAELTNSNNTYRKTVGRLTDAQKKIKKEFSKSRKKDLLKQKENPFGQK